MLLKKMSFAIKLNCFLNADVKEFNFDPRHPCTKCGYLLDEIACQTFDNLPDLETKISNDIEMSLLYIVRYVTRKDCSTKVFIFKNMEIFWKKKIVII